MVKAEKTSETDRGMALFPILALCILGLAGCDLTGFSSNPAKRLIKSKCSACHSTKRIYEVHRSREDWQQIVHRMVRHGAQLSTDEKEQILDYLESELSAS